MISPQKVFSVETQDDFNALALEVFNYQAQHCGVYHDYIRMLKIKEDEIKAVNEIPFLPVEFFKVHQVLTDKKKPEIVFESSGTTSAEASRHYMADTEIYIQSFMRCFEMFYGNIRDYCFLALLPSYLERKNSSLVFMADHLIKATGHPQSGFYLSEYSRLADTLQRLNKENKKHILLGVSFALLDFAEQFPVELPRTIVMETGGMKGRREEMTRQELHGILRKAFGLKTIHSEYGMTELLSQAYSTGGGIFQCPSWMRILLRNPDDPFDVSEKRQRGNINIIDLANLYSCSFVATQDVGRMHADGFEVLGRTDASDLRGCNLLVSEM